MDSVYLAYGRQLLEDCEDAWNESVDADITATADTTYFRVGSASCKLLAGDVVAEDDIMATEVISVSTLAAYTHVVLWSYSTSTWSAGAFDLLLDNTANCASPLEDIAFGAITANRWTPQVLTLANPSSDTSLVSIGIQAGASLEASDDIYVDDIFATVARQFDCLSIRGLSRPDDLVFWPPVSETLLDGTIHQDINAYRRRITLDLAAMTDTADFNFLVNWLMADYRYIIGTNDIVRVVMEEPEGHAFEWLSGLDLTKGATLTCLERSVRTTAPASWGY